jgi:hypothetical protein
MGADGSNGVSPIPEVSVRVAISLIFAASLAGCGVADPTTGQSEEAFCRGIHCGPCHPDPTSETGGTKICTDCSGDSFSLECRFVCPHRVVNVANAILANPQLVSVYWGDGFNTAAGAQEIAFHDATWTALAPSQVFWGRMAEYGVGTATYYGGRFLPGALPSVVTDQQIRDELNSQFVSVLGSLPDPLFTPYLYIVYLPDGVRADRNVPNHTGYHDSFNVNGLNVYYAVLDGVSTADTIDLVAAHEASEAATDAILGKGWNEVNNSNGEIADLCAPNNETIAGRLVPTVWSQQSCSCK